MKSKKTIALIISLTLIVSMTLPGTLAVSEDQAAVLDSYTLAEEEPAVPTSEEQACTCGTTDGTHAEGCPLYTAPEAPANEEKTCTCGTETGSDDENQSGGDAELYLAGVGDTAAGSTPTAAEGFVFVGWYSDEACTQPVEASWISDNKLVPGKTKNYGTEEAPVMGYEAATYYAKFAADAADLTITIQGEDIDEGQSVIFDVTSPDGYSNRVAINGSGTVTIKGLKTGTYTVTEVTAWSWRYTAGGSTQIVDLQPEQDSKVDFTNTLSNGKWLSGACYSEITFDS